MSDRTINRQVEAAPPREPNASFQELALDRGLSHYRIGRWPCEGPTPEFAEIPLRASFEDYDGEYKAHWVIGATEPDGTVKGTQAHPPVIHIDLHAGFITVKAAARNSDEAEAAIEAVKNLFPEAEVPDEKVHITFWSYSPQGPQSIGRQIDAPSWTEVSDNYGEDARKELARLVSPHFNPGFGGQLILWSGPPGTGKTSALRAVAQEWKKWAEVHYVVDPEKFFGEHSDYMMSVMMGHDSAKWKLLVLEDAGELVRTDASAITGKALMRMLNTVDGLIGQGLKILVLVTTNEELGKLNEAVTRLGRCASKIEFKALPSRQANEWREGHGLPTQSVSTVTAAITLAELYAELQGFNRQDGEERRIGFAA